MSQPPPAFLVVGIGASAGGIEALQAFFTEVPAGDGIAYVVTLHLSPEHESQLAAILQAATPLRVISAVERVRVEPDHIYVVPPNQHLAIDDGELAVSPNTLPEERRAPIDLFFRTLAEAYDGRGVCVVLSGSGADGSMGLKRVKERGGAVFVQSPREAGFSEMPRSAIATDLVDDVLPVAAIPARIAAYRASLGTVAIPLAADRRISANSFFRDREAFTTLEQEIIPRIFQGKRAGDQVRVWVVGCATGEEAYSIAMLCAERTMDGDGPDAPSVQVFASDIDETALAHARAGLYSSTDIAAISTQRLRRFFVQENDRYRVRTELRELVLFANHNILTDPPFAHIDLISCRNLLIHLNRAAQERVSETLHFALNEDGHLFLGTAESIDGDGDLFTPVSGDHHIYQRRPSGPRSLRLPEAPPPRRSLPTRGPALPSLIAATRAQPPERINYGSLHQRLLEQYAPPSVVVNHDFAIVHLSERAGRYLQIAGGELTSNVLSLIRPELREDLRTALSQALQHQTNVEARNLPLRIDDHIDLVSIHVRPALRHDDPAHGFLLVLFETGSVPPGDAEPVMRADEPATRQLEEEVLRLKRQLRSSSEQHELQAEELRATNKELLALNEELRASSEELHTSKEELQSINEELHALNQELKIKIDEATQTSANLQNLVNATDIATIFLDRGLQINLFTPAARSLFNLIAADYGRPLSDLSHRLLDVDVLADAEAVLARLQTIEREVCATDGRVFVMRALPYRAGEDQIGGVVLTFFDITERTRAERALAEQARLLDLSNDAIIVRDGQNRIQYWNRGATELYGWTREEAVGQDLHTLLQTEFEAPLAQLVAVLHKQDRMEGEVVQVTRDGRRLTALCRWALDRDPQGRQGSILTTYNDITERKRHETDLAFLSEIGDEFAHLSNAEEMIQAVGAKIGAYLRVSTCVFADVDEARGELAVSYAWNKTDVPSLRRTFRTTEYLTEEFVQASRAGKMVVVRDTQSDPRTDARSYAALDVRAFVSVPFHRDGVWTYYLGVTDRHPRNWRGHELELIKELSNRIFPRLERARAEAALRESEERFRLMADAVPQIVWLTDGDGRVEFFNKQWSDYTGVPYEPTTMAEVVASFVHPDDAALTLEALAEARRSGGVLAVEHRLRSAAGAYRWFLVRAEPYRDPQTGAILRWFGASVDIHDRRHAEARLQELYAQEQAARAQAEEASRLKDEFLATVSHELRTPLTALLGYTQLLQRSRRDEAYVARAVERMEQAAKAQAALIEDLLDVSRIVSGKLRIEPKPIELLDIVSAALDTVRPTVEAKGLQVKIDLDPEASAVVGDGNRLQQVVWNLLANAAKFTSPGGQIAVRLAPTKGSAELTVSDTGQGIPPDFLPYVFERFRQADSSSQRIHGGLGLGLAIVRHLVELHGGTVEATSAGVGKGATFTVRLPRAEAGVPAGQTGAAAPDAVKPEAEQLLLAGLRVLVVDDQPNILELVAELLAAEGATVQSCSTAPEAFALMRTWQPDVLVSDIAMPDADGYWLIRQVRGLSPEEGGATPAVALTAYVRLEDRLRLLAAGFQQYVPKPVDAVELRNVILGLGAKGLER